MPFHAFVEAFLPHLPRGGQRPRRASIVTAQATALTEEREELLRQVDTLRQELHALEEARERDVSTSRRDRDSLEATYDQDVHDLMADLDRRSAECDSLRTLLRRTLHRCEQLAQQVDMQQEQLERTTTAIITATSAASTKGSRRASTGSGSEAVSVVDLPLPADPHADAARLAQAVIATLRARCRKMRGRLEREAAAAEQAATESAAAHAEASALRRHLATLEARVRLAEAQEPVAAAAAATSTAPPAAVSSSPRPSASPAPVAAPTATRPGEEQGQAAREVELRQQVTALERRATAAEDRLVSEQRRMQAVLQQEREATAQQRQRLEAERETRERTLHERLSALEHEAAVQHQQHGHITTQLRVEAECLRAELQSARSGSPLKQEPHAARLRRETPGAAAAQETSRETAAQAEPTMALQEATQLQEKLVAMQETCSRLRAESDAKVAAAQRGASEAERKVTEAREQRRMALARAEAAEAARADAEAGIRAANAAVADARQARLEAMEAAGKARAEEAARAAQLSSVRRELDWQRMQQRETGDAPATTTDEQKRAAEQARDTAEAERSRLAATVTAMEAEVSQTRNALAAARRDHAGCDARIQIAEERRRDAETAVEDMRAAARREQSKLADMQGRVSVLESSQQAWALGRTRLEAAAAEGREIQQHQAETIRSLQRRLAEAHRELEITAERHRAELARLHVRVAQLEAAAKGHGVRGQTSGGGGVSVRHDSGRGGGERDPATTAADVESAQAAADLQRRAAQAAQAEAAALRHELAGLRQVVHALEEELQAAMLERGGTATPPAEPADASPVPQPEKQAPAPRRSTTIVLRTRELHSAMTPDQFFALCREYDQTRAERDTLRLHVAGSTPMQHQPIYDVPQIHSAGSGGGKGGHAKKLWTGDPAAGARRLVAEAGEEGGSVTEPGWARRSPSRSEAPRRTHESRDGAVGASAGGGRGSEMRGLSLRPGGDKQHSSRTEPSRSTMRERSSVPRSDSGKTRRGSSGIGGHMAQARQGEQEGGRGDTAQHDEMAPRGADRWRGNTRGGALQQRGLEGDERLFAGVPLTSEALDDMLLAGAGGRSASSGGRTLTLRRTYAL